MDRRAFLKGGAGLMAAGAMAAAARISPAWAAAQEPSNIRNFHPEMRYRPHGLTGVAVSALGFGMLRLPLLADGKTVDEARTIAMLRHAIDHGLNYVDTGYVYLGGQSEAVTGKALAGGYRDRIWLTSKSPWWIMERPEDFERFFDESRRRLQTDVIDFYHIHMIMHRGWKEKVVPFRLIDRMMELKARGAIRFAGFSFHDGAPLFKRVVDANPGWDFCLIQQNYLDTEHEAGLVGLNYAAANGMGVSIMEPLRNGFLVKPPAMVQAVLDAAPRRRPPVEWAFDYLWNRPEVSVVVSGMASMQNVRDNLAYAGRSAPGMLDAEDRAVIGRAARAYRSAPGTIPCTGCYNCIPCPQNVAIGYLFNMVFNQYKADGDKARAHRLVNYSMSPVQRGDRPGACNECGQCLPKCPQGINIPEELKRVRRELEL
ncbi:aldo/keto reductase [uncultured Desulfovibrio sp.]|uniref:aldo/keto reductase n=3 Tax=uncultured Desulfovibrio sp. TaxID=167968 RepID=UPI0025D9BD11|nr:aldo/keto reductase [uncultured Desulfovibrio sp.]